MKFLMVKHSVSSGQGHSMLCQPPPGSDLIFQKFCTAVKLPNVRTHSCGALKFRPRGWPQNFKSTSFLFLNLWTLFIFFIFLRTTGSFISIFNIFNFVKERIFIPEISETKLWPLIKKNILNFLFIFLFFLFNYCFLKRKLYVFFF